MFLNICVKTSNLPAYINQNLPVLLCMRKHDVLKPLVCYIMTCLKPIENYGFRHVPTYGGYEGPKWGQGATIGGSQNRKFRQCAKSGIL